MKRLLKGLSYDELCFVAFADSRLEIASISMVLDRERIRVLYVSFPWGPWKGSFYPYTPRPLEVVHEIHGIGSTPSLPRVVDVGGAFLQPLPRLRRETLLAQQKINASKAESPCYATVDGVECSCGSLTIEFTYSCTPIASIEIRDYCSWREVVESMDSPVDSFSNWGMGNVGFRTTCMKLSR